MSPIELISALPQGTTPFAANYNRKIGAGPALYPSFFIAAHKDSNILLLWVCSQYPCTLLNAIVAISPGK